MRLESHFVLSHLPGMTPSKGFSEHTKYNHVALSALIMQVECTVLWKLNSLTSQNVHL